MDYINGVLIKVDSLRNTKKWVKEQWKQEGHPTTHIIVQEVQGIVAHTGDILIYNNRQFEVQGCQNPGELNHYMLYYCMERLDKNG